MYKKCIPLFVLSILGLTSCENDDSGNTITDNTITVPATYSFERDGSSTVSFSGQTERILMAEELITAMIDFDNTDTQALLDMFANENTPFTNEDLNASSKSVKSKVAASTDYFSNAAATSATIRTDFETWMMAQVSEVFPARNTVATEGISGQIADGASTRYVNAKGFEYNQLVNKGLIGGLMLDQALNNYLSISVLDEGTNREDNDIDLVEDGKSYTTMEHKWDEAFGYVFGTAPDAANAIVTLGDDDSFLNKYIGRVEGDEDFTGIAQEIFDAFKRGRAAIVAKNYTVRDAQAAILREKLSEVIAIRAVYYLQQGKLAIEAGNFGTAFHDLSEGYGFIYSLQFTRNIDTNTSYFSKSEVDKYIATLSNNNGLWDVTPETLDMMSTTIADRFDFTIEQAQN